jgi:hypothetical protein
MRAVEIKVLITMSSLLNSCTCPPQLLRGPCRYNSPKVTMRRNYATERRKKHQKGSIFIFSTLLDPHIREPNEVYGCLVLK